MREEPKSETGGSENEEPNRPVWLLGQKHAPKPPQPSQGDGAPRGEDDKRQRHLEAYQRYKQMREATAVKQREDFEEEEERPRLKSRRLPAYNPDARVSRRRTDEWFEDAYGGRQNRPRRARQQRNLARDFAIAGVLSVVTGLVAGAVVYDRTSNGVVTQAILSTFDGWKAKAEAESVPAAVEPAKAAETQDIQSQPDDGKKPIATAALDVADVTGSANQLIPLTLRAAAAEPGQAVGFRLSGLPEAALLTAGTKLDGTTWQLKPGEERGIRLKLPPDQTQSFVISVEAIEPNTNDLVAPIQEMNVAITQSPQQTVMPAAGDAPEVKRNFNIGQDQQAAATEQEQQTIVAQKQERPPAAADQEQPTGVIEKQQPLPESQKQVAAAMPIPSPLEAASEPVAETFSLMRNGDKLMTMGDPVGARQFYLKALNLGDKQAALKVGQTYDPTIYAEMNVQGLKPDPQLALRYYLEARTAGDPGAETAIAGLDAWMQR